MGHQRNVRGKLLAAAALGGVLSAMGFSNDAMGITVHGVDETFENDQDAVAPPASRLEDPVDFDGTGAYDPALRPPGDNSPGLEDWFNGGVSDGGLIEEVPASSATYNTPAARNGSAHLGLVYRGDIGTFYSTADGPFGRLGRQSARPSTEPFGYHMDLYLEPNAVPSGGSAGGSPGSPDFWMTNAFNNAVGGGYMGETGFAGTIVDAGNGQVAWRFKDTDASSPLPTVDIPAGQWVTLEVTFDEDGQANGNDVQATFRILNAARTQELYNQVLNLTTLWDGTGFDPNTNLDGQASDLGGLRYTWFTSFDTNLERLIIDNIGTGGQIPLVPEPGSLALLGLPAAALLMRRRRKA